MKPTREQLDIIDAGVDLMFDAHLGGSVKAMAGAGAGKTSTLYAFTQKAHSVNPGVKILYLAYNREIKIEANSKFKNLAVTRTTHGMALEGMNWTRGRLKIGNLNLNHVKQALGGSTSDSDAHLILGTLRNFCNSHEPLPTEKHVPRPPGGNIDKARKLVIADRTFDLFEALHPVGRKQAFPMTHDVYLKSWQLNGAPGIEKFDVVMQDESQDANPVVLAAMESAGRAIYVGDSHQAIYQWRNAVDAMTKVAGVLYPMTKSFRFGPSVADVANRLLSKKKDKPIFQIEGFELINTSVGTVDTREKHTRIYRTNVGMIQEALLLSDQKVPFRIAGADVDFAKMLASLQAMKYGEMSKVRHHSVKWLKGWEHAQQVAESGGEFKDLAQGVKVLDKFDGRVDEILEFYLRPMPEEQARVTLITAHKSKGREYDQVILNADFDAVITRAASNNMLWDAEMNLAYVATTRAMKVLEIRSEIINSLLDDSVTRTQLKQQEMI